jgi:hypothetical protein
MTMTTIIMLRGTCLGDGRDAYPGDIVEVNDVQAAHLISQGRATTAVTPPAEADTQAVVEPKRKARKNG